MPGGLLWRERASRTRFPPGPPVDACCFRAARDEPDRVFLRPGLDADQLTTVPREMLEVLQRSGDSVSMTMAVFPQELLTLVSWPEHVYPSYSSICVTHGPVSAFDRSAGEGMGVGPSPPPTRGESAGWRSGSSWGIDRGDAHSRPLVFPATAFEFSRWRGTSSLTTLSR